MVDGRRRRIFGVFGFGRVVVTAIFVSNAASLASVTESMCAEIGSLVDRRKPGARSS